MSTERTSLRPSATFPASRPPPFSPSTSSNSPQAVISDVSLSGPLPLSALSTRSMAPRPPHPPSRKISSCPLTSSLTPTSPVSSTLLKFSPSSENPRAKPRPREDASRRRTLSRTSRFSSDSTHTLLLSRNKSWVRPVSRLTRHLSVLLKASINS
ncbi:60S ribosomal protein L4-A [Microsporum canis CBS 113480]|uniref:60S ribosomal protein L4-A n=1 Tax=Arthroderma otae (strain ATCC MYA-4605 / CBS 113480) TaxID=554155 RepID=C5FI88_ARTOC|nr:60S ribosomal protein L4-A [Microsporum canis CBS 113480]EEQ29068.1 60S ribosomal protein L4-A [Microsporum canis CBS 113480]